MAEIAKTPTGSSAKGGANRDGGGGVHCGGGDVALREVVLRGNRAEAFGGAAIYAGAGRVTLERCRVVDNAGGVGGAIIADGVATAPEVSRKGTVLLFLRFSPHRRSPPAGER